MPKTADEPATPAMTRDLKALASTEYDLVVIGGGVYGVWATLDAAQRGLKVALIEQNDFGSGTSANSQRVVHGGLRYLQHGDLKRMRESIRERNTLLRNAGHLVEPMPFLVPTYGLGMRGKPAMFTAMKLNDLISVDRNKGLSKDRRLPNGRLINTNDCLKMAPGIEPDGLTGGAIFYDAQVNNSERLTLAVLQSAIKAGATAANHLRVTGINRDGNRVTGVSAIDRFTGESIDIRARLTLACAGPWTKKTAALYGDDTGTTQKNNFEVIRAVALVTRDLFDGMGIAIPSRKAHSDNKELISKGFRNLFVTSWRGQSLIGTFYSDYNDDPDNLSVTPDEIRGYVEEFNQAYPSANLRYDDVHYTFMGLQPKAAAPGNSPGGDGTQASADAEPVASKRYQLIDHALSEQLEGLITVLGVKWTTARDVAEKAVTLAAQKLGGPSVPCQTVNTRLHGAPPSDPTHHTTQAIADRPDWASEQLIRELFDAYGLAYQAILAIADAEPHLREQVSDNRKTILAQIAYAARHEMAMTLGDVLFHRTDAGFLGYPGETFIQRAADLLAKELSWDVPRTESEIKSVQRAYQQRGLGITQIA